MKRIVNDTLISVAAVAILLVILVSVDLRVRDQVASTLSGASLGQAGARMTQAGSVLLTAARDQSVEHAPLAVFVVVGTVLFLLMVRS